MKVGKERYEQRRLQNLIILGISVLVVMAALVTIVGLPTAALVLIAGLVLFALDGPETEEG